MDARKAYKYRYIISLVTLTFVFIISKYMVDLLATYPSIYGDESAEFYGSMAEFFLVVTVGLAGINYIFRTGTMAKLVRDDALTNWINRCYVRIKSKLITIHIVSAVLLDIFATFHLLYLRNAVNLPLMAGYLLIIYNTLVGIMLKAINRKLKIYAYMLHVQWMDTILALVLLLIGHGMSELE